MTELCDARTNGGHCWLPQRHPGDHATREGKRFTSEESDAYARLESEKAGEPEYSMNRHERRAAKKMGKVW